MSDAEVMTTAIVAALFFGGSHEKARKFLQGVGYILQMFSKSRFNQRWHHSADLFWGLFHLLGETWKELNADSLYFVDSFPIAVCDNYRILRCRIYQGEDWRGYQASKKRYCYGLKVHLLITKAGQPVEFFLTPGSVNDTPTLKQYWFDLPEGSTSTGDKAYNDYGVEDLVQELGLHSTPLRKKNSKRKLKPWVHYLMSSYRKSIETTGTTLDQLLPKHIHAVTPAGFELKVAMFVLAYSLNYLVK